MIPTEEIDARPKRTSAKVEPVVLGMALFITSEVMFFGGLLSAYLAVRGAHGAWPPQGEPGPGLLWPALFTSVLVASSVTQHLAARAASSDALRARRFMVATVGLGLFFLAGQAWEWSQLAGEGLAVGSGVFGTLFFTITGAHGIHVLGGLVMLAVIAGRWGTSPRLGQLEAATYYWHFVDVVWVVLFACLYVGSQTTSII